MKERLKQLAKDWHEAGRLEFNKQYQNLDYDRDQGKRVVEARKYFYLDQACGISFSGAFIVDKATGTVWRLKSKYGVPNKRKVCGNIAEITGEKLTRLRWW